ncbi:MAG: diguanylate cyclase domain-containing protein [Pseudomonadota bacterium]
MRSKYAIILFIILLLSLSFYHAADMDDMPIARNGVLDLTDRELGKNGPVLLDGEWEVYLNQLISPEDFRKGVTAKPAYISFPATGKDFAKLVPGLRGDTYATFRLRVRLRDTEKMLGLKTYIMFSSYRVYVNDEFKAEVGKVGTSREESTPYYMNSQVYFQRDGDEVEIIYHASDFHLNDLSIRSPLLGLDTQIEKQASFSLGKDMFLFGSLFIMSIYHLGLYAKRRKDRAPLYFGLLCLLMALRALVTGERFLEQVLFLPHEAFSKTAYIAAYMSLPALIHFLDKTISKLFWDKLVKITDYVCIALSLVTLLTSIRFYDVFLNPFFIFMAAVLVYVLTRLVLAACRKTRYAGFVLLGFLAIGATAANDVVYQNKLTGIGSIVPIGVFLFIFSQSYLLASKFSSAFSETEKLTIENQSIMKELKELNQDLERKVEERTEELNVLMIELESSNMNLKESMEQLALEVEEHKQAEQEISAAYEKIDSMSKTDYLTKLSNRRDIFERMQKEEQQGASTVYSVVICDIDHFKAVNDTYGHSTGDKVLIKTAELLRSAVSPEDCVARWGGEEFLLLLKNTEGNKAKEIMEKLRSSIENESLLEGNNRISITMTFGICQFDGTTSFENCIARADKALYQGKKSGRNKVVLGK